MGRKFFSGKKLIYIENTFFIYNKPLGQGKNAKGKARQSLEEKIMIAAKATGVTLSEHSNIAILIDIIRDKANINFPDIDNLVKPLLDSLKGIAYHDDSQVRSLQVNYLEEPSNAGAVDGDIHPPYLPLFATWHDEAKKYPVIFISIGKVGHDHRFGQWMS